MPFTFSAPDELFGNTWASESDCSSDSESGLLADADSDSDSASDSDSDSGCHLQAIRNERHCADGADQEALTSRPPGTGDGGH